MSIPPILGDLLSRPAMHVGPATYDAILGYMQGCDAAMRGGLLIGFREWLIVRVGEGNNLAWPELVELVSEAGEGDRGRASGDARRIAALHDLLGEFYKARNMANGLRRMMCAYEEWLAEQTWYGPESADWVPARASRPDGPGRHRSSRSRNES
jgi:hypothetical protein